MNRLLAAVAIGCFVLTARAEPIIDLTDPALNPSLMPVVPVPAPPPYPPFLNFHLYPAKGIGFAGFQGSVTQTVLGYGIGGALIDGDEQLIIGFDQPTLLTGLRFTNWNARKTVFDLSGLPSLLQTFVEESLSLSLGFGSLDSYGERGLISINGGSFTMFQGNYNEDGSSWLFNTPTLVTSIVIAAQSLTGTITLTQGMEGYDFSTWEAALGISNIGDLTIGYSQPSDFALAAIAIPEPQTYAMLLAGLSLLGFMGRRRKQKAPAIS